MIYCLHMATVSNVKYSNTSTLPTSLGYASGTTAQQNTVSAKASLGIGTPIKVTIPTSTKTTSKSMPSGGGGGSSSGTSTPPSQIQPGTVEQAKISSQIAEKYNPIKAGADARAQASREGKTIEQKYAELKGQQEAVQQRGGGTAQAAREREEAIARQEARVEAEQAQLIKRYKAGDQQAEQMLVQQQINDNIRPRFQNEPLPKVPYNKGRYTEYDLSSPEGKYVGTVRVPEGGNFRLLSKQEFDFATSDPIKMAKTDRERDVMARNLALGYSSYTGDYKKQVDIAQKGGLNLTNKVFPSTKIPTTDPTMRLQDYELRQNIKSIMAKQEPGIDAEKYFSEQRTKLRREKEDVEYRAKVAQLRAPMGFEMSGNLSDFNKNIKEINKDAEKFNKDVEKYNRQQTTYVEGLNQAAELEQKRIAYEEKQAKRELSPSLTGISNAFVVGADAAVGGLAEAWYGLATGVGYFIIQPDLAYSPFLPISSQKERRTMFSGVEYHATYGFNFNSSEPEKKRKILGFEIGEDTFNEGILGKRWSAVALIALAGGRVVSPAIGGVLAKAPGAVRVGANLLFIGTAGISIALYPKRTLTDPFFLGFTAGALTTTKTWKNVVEKPFKKPPQVDVRSIDAATTTSKSVNPKGNIEIGYEGQGYGIAKEQSTGKIAKFYQTVDGKVEIIGTAQKGSGVSEAIVEMPRPFGLEKIFGPKTVKLTSTADYSGFQVNYMAEVTSAKAASLINAGKSVTVIGNRFYIPKSVNVATSGTISPSTYTRLASISQSIGNVKEYGLAKIGFVGKTWYPGSKGDLVNIPVTGKGALGVTDALSVKSTSSMFKSVSPEQSYSLADRPFFEYLTSGGSTSPTIGGGSPSTGGGGGGIVASTGAGGTQTLTAMQTAQPVNVQPVKMDLSTFLPKTEIGMGLLSVARTETAILEAMTVSGMGGVSQIVKSNMIPITRTEPLTQTRIRTETKTEPLQIFETKIRTTTRPVVEEKIRFGEESTRVIHGDSSVFRFPEQVVLPREKTGTTYRTTGVSLTDTVLPLQEKIILPQTDVIVQEKIRPIEDKLRITEQIRVPPIIPTEIIPTGSGSGLVGLPSGFALGLGSGFPSKGSKLKVPLRYVPSFAAGFLGITSTKTPSVLTGFGIRPIIVAPKRTRKPKRTYKRRKKK